MIAVSNDFKTAMTKPIKELDAYIQIDEDNKITSFDDLISFKISCDSGMCKTAMRKLEAKYLGEHNLLGQWVHVGFGVRLPNGTFEYLDYGSFLVTEITTIKDTGVTTISGYDKMVNSMIKYNKLTIEYPINLYDYTKRLCTSCGLELGNNIFGNNLLMKQGMSTPSTDDDFWLLSNSTPLNDGWIKAEYDNTNGSNRAYANQFVKQGNIQGLKGNTKYTFYFEFRNISNTSNVNTFSFGETQNNTVWASGKTLKINELPQKACYTLTTKNDVSIPTLDLRNFISIAVGSTASLEYRLMIVEGEHTLDTIQKYIPYNDMNNWLINQELWENINGITYRDILVQIAQATASTCIISNDDKVYFKPICSTGESLTYDNMKKLKLEPMYGEINSVVLSRTPQEDNIYMRDEESIQLNGLTEYKIENNEIIDKDRDNAMTPIYNALHGISYYPFETTTEGLGWYEIADNFDIVNDTGDVFNTSLFNFSITIDGSIKEILKTVADTKTQTQYQYATTIAKRVKNTEIIVNKQEQYIEQLVTDMYEEDGVINESFTNVYQDITNIVNSVQNSGGSNLIKNSVMFAYDDNDNPINWDVEGDGILEISSSAEALANGSLSGHIFTLTDKTVKQKVLVKLDSDDVAEDKKVYYTFSTKIKKDTTGTCYVKLYNANEEYIIELGEGESSYYGDYEIKALLPKDTYYIIEFYGSQDSNATFTDNMFAIGDYKTQWQQASGEIMNTQVNINIDGVLIKSSVYLGDYTVMSPLEFAGYSNINGTVTKVFSLNKDTTLVKKLESEDEFKMVPIKIVPIKTGDLKGWAFVPCE